MSTLRWSFKDSMQSRKNLRRTVNNGLGSQSPQKTGQFNTRPLRATFLLKHQFLYNLSSNILILGHFSQRYRSFGMHRLWIQLRSSKWRWWLRIKKTACRDNIMGVKSYTFLDHLRKLITTRNLNMRVKIFSLEVSNISRNFLRRNSIKTSRSLNISSPNSSNQSILKGKF